jgi:hypothetical protein
VFGSAEPIWRHGQADERQCLMALLADEPGNTAAWARLAEMAQKAWQGAEAESFRKAQAEASVLRERYIQLFMRDDRSRHAGELNRLARELGRPIEARGWTLIEEGRAATEPLWPEMAREAHPAESTQVLASSMGDLLPSANETGVKPAAAIALGVIAIGRPPRPSLTWTATAILISTSATTSFTIRTTPGFVRTPIRLVIKCVCRAIIHRSRITCSAMTTVGSSP